MEKLIKEYKDKIEEIKRGSLDYYIYYDEFKKERDIAEAKIQCYTQFIKDLKSLKN